MSESAIAAGKIVVTEGMAAGKEFLLDSRTVFEIGRAASSNIEIPDGGVAMNHCRIYKEQGIYTLYDLNTKKGTFINGERITKQILRDGDTIQIGPVLMVFRNPEGAAAPMHDEEDMDLEPPPWEAPVEEDEKAAAVDEAPYREEVPIEPEPAAEQPTALDPRTARAAKLTVLEGPIAGTVFALEGKNSYSIGRASEADVKVMDIKISRNHSGIVREEGRYFLVDRDSRNGTYLNGEQIEKSPLKDGDHVKVGFSIMQFNLVGATPAPPLAPERQAPAKRKPAAKKRKKVVKEKKAVPESPTSTRRRAMKAAEAGELSCDLCSRELAPEDIESGLAVTHGGKSYCLTCVRKLQNLASGGGPGAAGPKEDLDDEDIDLLLREDVSGEDEDLFP